MVMFQFHQLLVFLQLVAYALSAVSSDELVQLKSFNDGIIYLQDGESFDKVVNGPRDYFVSLLFTSTNPAINCGTCQKFDKNYKKVARSYYESNPNKDSIFFFILEFNDNVQNFEKIGLTQVPKLWIFPPGQAPNYNISSPHFPFAIGDSAIDDILEFANFVSKITQENIFINADFEPTQFLTYFITTFVTVLILKKKVLNKLGRAKIIKFLTLISIVILISGYMFTVIRGIPLIAKNEKGEIMHMSGGTHWQFGLETFMISGIYLTLIGLFVLLTIQIPKVTNERKRLVLTLSTSVGIFYVFNYLTKVYLVKDPGYPYKLTNYF